MSAEPQVARRQVEIINPLGLHLRPANKFVLLAGRFQSEVRVYSEGLEVNGKSILDLSTLAAECGTHLDLEARGPDAEAAVDALAELVLAGFYEDGRRSGTCLHLNESASPGTGILPASPVIPVRQPLWSLKRLRRCSPFAGLPSALASPLVRSGSSTPAASGPRRAPLPRTPWPTSWTASTSPSAAPNWRLRPLRPMPANGSARSMPTSSRRMPG